MIWKEFSIDFIDEEKNTCVEVGLSTIADFCNQLIASDFTQKLINNKLPIAKIITEDIGKTYHRYHTRKEYEEILKHFFTSNVPRGKDPKVHSWMYNDEQGRILLQVGSAFEQNVLIKKLQKNKKILQKFKPFNGYYDH